MMFVRLFIALVVTAALSFPAHLALGQPAGPTAPIEKRFQALDPPEQAEVLQVVLEFAPGSWTPVHVHGGPAYVTVLEGEMLLRMADTEEKFSVGEGWIDNPDEPHAAGNEGTVPARVVATFVLPRGATPTTVVGTGAQADLPPGPTTIAQFRTDASGLSGPRDLIHRVLEFNPGVSAARHYHPGPNFVTVLQGQVTIREDAGERTSGALQSFMEPAGLVHSGQNMTTERTRVIAAAFVPRGGSFSVAAPEAAPPDTSPLTPAVAPAPLSAPAAQPAAPAPVQLPRSR
jgi:quercetin dioxygenase-like cupin family protein